MGRRFCVVYHAGKKYFKRRDATVHQTQLIHDLQIIFSNRSGRLSLGLPTHLDSRICNQRKQPTRLEITWIDFLHRILDLFIFLDEEASYPHREPAHRFPIRLQPDIY